MGFSAYRVFHISIWFHIKFGSTIASEFWSYQASCQGGYYFAPPGMHIILNTLKFCYHVTRLKLFHCPLYRVHHCVRSQPCRLIWHGFQGDQMIQCSHILHQGGVWHVHTTSANSCAIVNLILLTWIHFRCSGASLPFSSVPPQDIRSHGTWVSHPVRTHTHSSPANSAAPTL